MGTRKRVMVRAREEEEVVGVLCSLVRSLKTCLHKDWINLFLLSGAVVADEFEGARAEPL